MFLCKYKTLVLVVYRYLFYLYNLYMCLTYTVCTPVGFTWMFTVVGNLVTRPKVSKRLTFKANVIIVQWRKTHKHNLLESWILNLNRVMRLADSSCMTSTLTFKPSCWRRSRSGGVSIATVATATASTTSTVDWPTVTRTTLAQARLTLTLTLTPTSQTQYADDRPWVGVVPISLLAALVSSASYNLCSNGVRVFI